MVPIVQIPFLALLGLAGAVLVGLAVGTRRHWDDPGGVSFSVLVFVTGLWAFAVVGGYVVEHPERGIEAAGSVGFLFMFVFPVLWAVFSLEYLGRSELVKPRYLSAIAVPVGLCLGLTVYWLVLGREFGDPSALVVLVFFAYMTVFYGGVAVVLIVSAFVVRAGYSHDYVEVGESVALALGAVGLSVTVFVASTLSTADGAVVSQAVIVPAMSLAWAVAAAGFVLAYRRYGVFESMPATGAIGTDMVVAEMDDPMVVVDADERVLEVNPRARDRFQFDRAGETTLAEAFGYTVTDLRLYEDVTLPTAEGSRLYETTVSAVTDRNDRPLGHVVVFHDVTARRRRKQRLMVLNRVLRHNLRNDVTAVMNWSELIADGRDPEPLANRIHDTAEGMVDTSDKAREVERLMALEGDPEAVVPIRRTVEYAVEKVREEYDGWTATVDVDASITVRADGRVLEPVVRNLVENAVEHNDAEEPRVEMGAERDGDEVLLTVTDNGRGLPPHERKVLQEGQETPLKHGSGLGLWTVRWGVTRVGGTVAFGDSDTGGTVVEVTLPAGSSLPAPAGSPDESTEAEEATDD